MNPALSMITPDPCARVFVSTERLTEADDLHVHDGGQGPIHDLRDARALDRIRALLESDLVAALDRTFTVTVRPGHAYRAAAQDQGEGWRAGRAVWISCFHYVSGGHFEGIDFELSPADASEGEDHQVASRFEGDRFVDVGRLLRRSLEAPRGLLPLRALPDDLAALFVHKVEALGVMPGGCDPLSPHEERECAPALQRNPRLAQRRFVRANPKPRTLRWGPAMSAVGIRLENLQIHDSGRPSRSSHREATLVDSPPPPEYSMMATYASPSFSTLAMDESFRSRRHHFHDARRLFDGLGGEVLGPRF